MTPARRRTLVGTADGGVFRTTGLTKGSDSVRCPRHCARGSLAVANVLSTTSHFIPPSPGRAERDTRDHVIHRLCGSKPLSASSRGSLIVARHIGGSLSRAEGLVDVQTRYIRAAEISRYERAIIEREAAAARDCSDEALGLRENFLREAKKALAADA